MGKKSRLKKERKGAHPENVASDSARPTEIKIPSKRIFFPLAFTVIFIAGVLLRIYNLTDVPARSPDEGVHTVQASVIMEEGPIQGTRVLVRRYNAIEEEWLYPKPIRIGYMWPLSFLMKAFKRTDIAAGAYLSCIFSIASLGIVVLFGMRFFNRWIALYALTFMSFSSIPLAIARRTWSDAMLGFLGLLLTYFSCEIIRSKGKLTWFLPFVITGSYSLTVKESGALFYAFCVAWILWVLCIKEKTYIKGIVLLALVGAGVGASVLLTLYSCGGLGQAMEVMKHFNEAIPSNTYSIEYMSGPWHQFIGAFWIISPVNASLWVFAFGSLLFSEKSSNKDINSGIIGLTIALIAATLLSPNVQNMRYLSPIFGAFYLIGGLGLWQAMLAIRKNLNSFYFSLVSTCIGIALLAGAIGDYQTYRKIFLRTGIVDASIRLIREGAR
jgi:hypothetical protein